MHTKTHDEISETKHLQFPLSIKSLADDGVFAGYASVFDVVDNHNALVGGAPRSMHLEGRAFDISLRNFEKAELIKILEFVGFTGLGVQYHSFVHADTGPKRKW